MTATPLQLAPQDFVRSYDLIDTIDATIPTRAQPGEPGTHWVARGLLAETCAQLLGRPIALEYYEKHQVVFISARLSLAATVLSSDPFGALLGVDLLISRVSGRWALLSGDRMLGSGLQLPSPAYLAGLVAESYASGRETVGGPCRAPVARPKYLW